MDGWLDGWLHEGLGGSCGTRAQKEEEHDDAGDEVQFGRDIRPLMDRLASDPTGHGCRACHYSTEPSHTGIVEVQLDMATLGALRRGGAHTSANIIIPGDPAHSALVQKLRGTYPDGLRMPRDGPPYWTEAQINLVERWIAQGAKGYDSE